MRESFMNTERIGFSHWTEDDFSLAMQLWGDKEVTEFICSTGVFTKLDIRDRLNIEINNNEKFNVQYWPIFEKTTGNLLGCCGVRPFKSEPRSFELGFHLRKKYWGQGYAYEAAKAVLEYSFTSLYANVIFAGHHPENLPSKKLLEKLGFKFIGNNFYEPTGLYHPSYKITKESI